MHLLNKKNQIVGNPAVAKGGLFTNHRETFRAFFSPRSLLWLFIVAFFLPFLRTSSVHAGAERTMIWVRIDNEHIQTYKNRLGEWLIPGRKTLSRLAREYGTTVEQIQKINDGDPARNRYIFVPMSEERYYTLLKNDKGRRLLQIDPRKMLWPLEDPGYTSRFGPRHNMMHQGLDIACPKMTPVVAAMDGEVVNSGWFGGMGNAVSLRHAGDLHTWYGHNTVILVKPGDHVVRGQVLAYSGSTGYSTGPHLHFEVRYLEVALNPEDFLPSGLTRPDLVLREKLPAGDPSLEGKPEESALNKIDFPPPSL